MNTKTGAEAPVFFYGMITVMIVAVLFIFGLILGSFVNALVWRLHEQSKGQKRKRSSRAKSKDPLTPAGDPSILHGRKEV